MTRLKISVDLSLPPEAVTLTFAILAKRGGGKTYTALVLVEELLAADAQRSQCSSHDPPPPQPPPAPPLGGA